MQRSALTALAALTFALLTLGASGCGGSAEYVVNGTDKAAGVDGMITISEADGANEILIALKHLPPPSRIGTGNTIFVVWYVTGGGGATKAGQLIFDEGERTGKLRATTPVKKLTVQISAEKNINASSPSEHIIISKNIQL